MPIRFSAASRISIAPPMVVANIEPSADAAMSVTLSFAEKLLKAFGEAALQSASDPPEAAGNARKMRSPAASARNNGVPVMVVTSGWGAG